MLAELVYVVVSKKGGPLNSWDQASWRTKKLLIYGSFSYNLCEAWRGFIEDGHGGNHIIVLQYSSPFAGSMSSALTETLTVAHMDSGSVTGISPNPLRFYGEDLQQTQTSLSEDEQTLSDWTVLPRGVYNT